MHTKKISVAFYNLENLFDTVNDPHILDDDFTAQGQNNWTPKRYENKLRKLAEVISRVSEKETGGPPVIIGIAEVENKKVLKDLIAEPVLKEYGYDFVHYNSPDERGIDTALLYRSAFFDVIYSEPITLNVESYPGVRDYTRDILYVHGELSGEEVHILVNHWPSRREGAEITQHKRIAAAETNRVKIDEILAENPMARIIVMGDLNADPEEDEVRNALVQTDLYNPMIFLHTRYEGSLNHRFTWHLFDQIILSHSWMKAYDNPLVYDRSDIYNDHYLTEYDGKFKGNPFRTYAGPNYLGGYSDHFPVYCVFKIED